MNRRLYLPDQPIMQIILCLLLVAAVLIPVLTLGAGANEPIEVSILLDGDEKAFDSPPIMIVSTTYVPLIEFCLVIDPDSTVGDYSVGTVTSLGMPISASDGDCYIVVNGRYLYTPTLCRMIGDELYVPLRPLASAFGLNVIWLPDTKTVVLISAYDLIESGEKYYDSDEVYWMSRIINAEAGGEPMSGKIAVGNVVMNRTGASFCPNTIYDVIFDNKFGVQFTPAYSGAIHRSPNQDSIVAAKLALEGADIVGDSLFFNVRNLKSWASQNRPYITTIGNHSFYG